MKQITFYSECDKEYSDGLKNCDSLSKLVAYVVKWKPLASDAYEIVRFMNTIDWDEFLKGWKKERRGKFAGEEWSAKYGAIILPEMLLRVSMTAMQFKVPWGLAFHRLKDNGLIKSRNRIYVWTGKLKNDTNGS